MRQLISIVVMCFVSLPVLGQSPLLQPKDRVALVGGTFVERMQSDGALEAELQCRRPDWQIRVRNLGWSGDDVHGIARKRFDGPEDGFKRLLSDIETADPTVVIVAYGSAEASDGAEAMKRFEPGLRRLIESLVAGNRRVILVTPIPMPGFRTPNYRDWISQAHQIIHRVGSQLDIPVIDPQWEPSPGELTPDQLLPNPAGYRQYAKRLADRLVGGESCSEISGELLEKIRFKNQLFFHRYRPQNETYLYLFRKHEQGNNAVEIPQFDPLIEKADRAIWQAAARS